MSLQILQGPTSRQRQTRYVALTTGFDSPFNLYLRLGDLGRVPLLAFLVYSLGSQAVLAWGHYDTRTQEFQLAQACQARASLLASLNRELPGRGYEYVANSVRDRITALLVEQPPTLDAETYSKVKYALAVEAGELSWDTATSVFAPLDLEQWWTEWLNEAYPLPAYVLTEEPLAVAAARQAFLAARQAEVAEYEARLNRTDVDREILRSLAKEQATLLLQITQQLPHWLVQSGLNEAGVRANWPLCLARSECETTTAVVCEVYTLEEELDLR